MFGNYWRHLSVPFRKFDWEYESRPSLPCNQTLLRHCGWYDGTVFCQRWHGLLKNVIKAVASCFKNFNPKTFESNSSCTVWLKLVRYILSESRARQTI